MATESVRMETLNAAQRLRDELHKADEKGYGVGAWYFYLRRQDIETVVEHVLGPVVEPNTDGQGNVVTAREVDGDEFEELTGDLPSYTTGTGQLLRGVHDPSQCEGRGCVIHHPSEHHMREWPTNWRSGGLLDIKPPHMERICPHGVGHPDPDDLAFVGDAIAVHGCDGCCKPGSTGPLPERRYSEFE